MNDNRNLAVSGVYRDIIRNVNTGDVFATPWQHNLVVTSALNLITSLFGGKTSNGLKYWAVGSGADSWDETSIDPQLSETTLTNEIGRKLISTDDIEFYDSNNKPSVKPTNRLHISLTFNEDECNGKWREFGLFGGDASAVMNTGIMVDKKHHSIITKTNETTIERHIILTFTLN